MTEEAKAAQRDYKREWQRANKDKVRAQQERYWQKRAEMAKAENPEATEAQQD